MRQIAGSVHETRSAGISAFCPRPLTGADLVWAEVVGVMEADHWEFIAERWPEQSHKVRVLEIEDRYHRHDPALLRLLEGRLWDLLAELKVV